MKISDKIILLLTIASAAGAGSIEHLGDEYISGFYETLVLQNNRAYVANVYGMVTLDVTDPANILWLGHQSSPGYSYGLDMIGNLAYLADWEDDLMVVDVGNPQLPQVIQGLSLPGEVWAIDVSGDVAAVACGSAGVYLLDVSNPDSAFVLSDFGISNFAVDVLILGEWMFIAGWDGGVFSALISDPEAPQLVGEYTNNPGIVRGFNYQAGFLYLAEENYGLEVLYVGNPANLQWVGAAPSSTSDYFRLSAVGNRLYVCSGLDGLKVFSITMPGQPILLGTVPTDGEVWGALAANNRLWVTDGPGGLIVYDISDTNQVVELGRYEILGNVLGVARNADVVYAAAKQDGLQAFQISGSDLQWRGQAATADSARAVTLNGDVAYVACGEAGIEVFDVSSPYVPVHLTTVNTPGFARRLTVAGDTGWVADRSRGVTVLDISTPSSAAIITSINTTGQAMGLAIRDSLLYVAARTAGLTIYDVANLNLPILLGGVSMPDSAMDVALYGDYYALVADFAQGLRICDVSDPQMAAEVAHVDLPGHAERVMVDDHWAFVALHDKGVAVVDLADPENPVINAYQESPGSAVDLAINGQQIIMADTYCLGLYAFNPTAVEPVAGSSWPEDFALLEPYPNPFNPSTTLGFALPKPEFVSLEVFDLSGREVIQVASGLQQPGTHQVVFEASGLPSGIYIVRFQAGSFQAAQKLLLLK